MCAHVQPTDVSEAGMVFNKETDMTASARTAEFGDGGNSSSADRTERDLECHASDVCILLHLVIHWLAFYECRGRLADHFKIKFADKGNMDLAELCPQFYTRLPNKFKSATAMEGPGKIIFGH